MLQGFRFLARARLAAGAAAARPVARLLRVGADRGDRVLRRSRQGVLHPLGVLIGGTADRARVREVRHQGSPR